MDEFDEEREYALLSDIAYLAPEKRNEEAMKYGYTVKSQDADRVYFTAENKPPVIAFRGTDLKKKSTMWRDIYTDTAVLFGKFEKTPRAIANEAFVQKTLAGGDKDVRLTGHSLGGISATVIGKEYGLKTTVYNPAFGLPEVAKAFKERVLENRRISNLTIYTVEKDPISMGAMFSLTGKVYKKKPKAGVSAHSIKQFI